MGLAFDQHVAAVHKAVAAPSAAAQSRLMASWQRSIGVHKLDPGRQHRPYRLTAAELRNRCAADAAMIRAAAPILDHLFKALRLSGCALFLADRGGCVLDLRAELGDQADLSACNLVPGADWSEAAEGTNGIGTCATDGRAITVEQGAHFSARNIRMTCIGAPIFGPQGELAGVLDASSARQDHAACLNGLIAETVTQAARSIEAELFREAHPTARIVMLEGWVLGASGLMAVDQDDVVIGATHAARKSLGLRADTVFSPIPAADLLGRTDSHAGFDRAEYAAMKRALLRANGNVSAAARALGIGRATLYRRMGRTGLIGADLAVRPE
ncbi:MAG: GAF domain-containing protein [Pseudomonadota bacterium]